MSNPDIEQLRARVGGAVFAPGTTATTRPATSTTR